MQIPYSGQVTKKEYASAMKIHCEQRYKWLKFVFGAILIVQFLAWIILLIGVSAKLLALFPYFLIIAILFTFPWWVYLISSSTYNQKGNIYRTPVFGFIDDNGITINTKDAQHSFRWHVYTHFLQRDGLILVYQSKNCFNIFTRTMLGSREEWVQFEDFLKRRFSERVEAKSA